MASRSTPKHVTLTVIGGLILGIAQSAMAEDMPFDPNAHGTGWRPPTAEERAVLDANDIIARRIHPNRLALSRLNAERALRALTPIAEATVSLAAEHEEIDGATRIGGKRRVASLVAGAGQAQVSAAAVLPVAVDNSAEIWFPPVRNQGGIGSCASFTTTYYVGTYIWARQHGINTRNNDDTLKLSPKLVYNLLSAGNDNGSHHGTAFSTLIDRGAPSWATLPYDGDYKSLPTTPGPWRDALHRRLGSTGVLESDDQSENLAILKQLLANGDLASYATQIYGWHMSGIGNDPTTTLDDPAVGQSGVVSYIQDGAHAMTVVGYNDAVWIDRDQDGQIDADERGALKVVNSWGTGWGTGGFAWVPYALYLSTGIIDEVRWAKPLPTFSTPALIGEVTLNTANRGRVYVALGYGATSAVLPTVTQTATTHTGGIAFDGGTAASDATIAIDVSSIAHSGAARRWFASVWSSTGSGGAATIVLKGFRLTDAAGTVLATAAQTNPAGGLPRSTTVDRLHAYVDHQLPGDSVAPAPVTDLSLVWTASTSFRVGFAQTGDDGQAGWVSAYDLRRSSTPITEATWASATVMSPPGVSRAGSASQFTASAVPSATTMYVALKARDEVGNWSGLSNVITVATSGVLDVATANLPSATVDSGYQQTLAASGGTPPFTWRLKPGYVEDPTGSATMTTGVAQNWKDTGSHAYVFPTGFRFPVLTSAGSTVATGLQISANGTIRFDGVTPGLTLQTFGLSLASLVTSGASEDVFIDQQADRLTVRWKGHPSSVTGEDGSVNHQATFFANGDIRLTYGAITGTAATLYPEISLQPHDYTWLLLSTRNYRAGFAAGATSLLRPMLPPPGLSLSSAGSLSGTPTLAGAWSFIPVVSDGGQVMQTAERSLTLTVDAGGGTSAPAITTQPTNVTKRVGQSATVTVAVSGTPTPTIRWQRSPDGSTWTDISGATTASYTTASLALSDNSTRFRAVATNAGGSVTSTAVTLTVRRRGDANLDGAVDISDLIMVKQAFGGTAAASDLSGDGAVDISDLILVKQEFGL